MPSAAPRWALAGCGRPGCPGPRGPPGPGGPPGGHGAQRSHGARWGGAGRRIPTARHCPAGGHPRCLGAGRRGLAGEAARGPGRASRRSAGRSPRPWSGLARHPLGPAVPAARLAAARRRSRRLPALLLPALLLPGSLVPVPGRLVRLVAVAPSGGTQIGERLDRRRRRRESVGLRRGQPVIGQRVPGAVVLPRAVGLVDGVGRHTAVTAAGRTRTFGLVVRHGRIGRHGRVAVSGVPGLPRLRDVWGLPAAQAVCAGAGARAGHGGLARLIVPRARARAGGRWTGVRGTAAGRGIRLTGPARVTSVGRRPVGRRSLRVDRGERVGAGRQERLEVVLALVCLLPGGRRCAVWAAAVRAGVSVLRVHRRCPGRHVRRRAFGRPGRRVAIVGRHRSLPRFSEVGNVNPARQGLLPTAEA